MMEDDQEMLDLMMLDDLEMPTTKNFLTLHVMENDLKMMSDDLEIMED
jgi:hypothetical protein